jgi:hypothetical protein
VQGLGNRLNRADHDHLIARLGDLPGAVVADMDDRLAEQRQQRARTARAPPPCRRP